jgi:light-regulated signal transduction histidine kinase (bacteriophytochrome)
MGQLIDALLQLSRVTRTDMRRERVDLSSIACSVVEGLRLNAPARKVDVHIAPGLGATGDPHLLQVVLQNLLGNAFKFTSRREHSAIEFGSFQQNGCTVFFVRDNGAGFQMEYANKLFGAFQRLHTPSEFEGTGIGLATVQRIIRRHGGHVWGEGAPDKGATFYFTLS